MSDLQKRIDEALDTAVFENEFYDLMARTSEEVTVDLMAYCASLEDENKDDVKACVQAYMVWYKQHA